MPVSGNDLIRLARKHVGERYVLGTLVPKDNWEWKGPWDCAEFASWLVYQASRQLYGCDDVPKGHSCTPFTVHLGRNNPQRDGINCGIHPCETTVKTAKN